MLDAVRRAVGVALRLRESPRPPEDSLPQRVVFTCLQHESESPRRQVSSRSRGCFAVTRSELCQSGFASFGKSLFLGLPKLEANYDQLDKLLGQEKAGLMD